GNACGRPGKAEGPLARAFLEDGAPYGIRTRVLALRGPRPRPLDEGSRVLREQRRRDVPAAPAGQKGQGAGAACSYSSDKRLPNTTVGPDPELPGPLPTS